MIWFILFGIGAVLVALYYTLKDAADMGHFNIQDFGAGLFALAILLILSAVPATLFNIIFMAALGGNTAYTNNAPVQIVGTVEATQGADGMTLTAIGVDRKIYETDDPILGKKHNNTIVVREARIAHPWLCVFPADPNRIVYNVDPSKLVIK